MCRRLKSLYAFFGSLLIFIIMALALQVIFLVFFFVCPPLAPYVYAFPSLQAILPAFFQITLVFFFLSSLYYFAASIAALLPFVRPGAPRNKSASKNAERLILRGTACIIILVVFYLMGIAATTPLCVIEPTDLSPFRNSYSQ